MKIIHISDLHYPKTEKTLMLIKQIILHYEDLMLKPTIVITGDILESSTRKKHFQEARLILKQLVDDGYLLLLCPGNHDVKFEGLGPMINGGIRFNNFFSSLLPIDLNYYGEEDNNLVDYPICHQIENHFFIGLNTLQKEKGFGATGELGEEQINELAILLKEIRADHEDANIIVYLHHHPLKFSYRPELMKLKDKEEFLNTIQGVNVLLFGHLHHNERFAADEEKYDINIISLAGGSVFGSGVDWMEIETEDYEMKNIHY